MIQVGSIFPSQGPNGKEFKNLNARCTLRMLIVYSSRVRGKAWPSLYHQAIRKTLLEIQSFTTLHFSTCKRSEFPSFSGLRQILPDPCFAPHLQRDSSNPVIHLTRLCLRTFVPHLTSRRRPRRSCRTLRFPAPSRSVLPATRFRPFPLQHTAHTYRDTLRWRGWAAGVAANSRGRAPAGGWPKRSPAHAVCTVHSHHAVR